MTNVSSDSGSPASSSGTRSAIDLFFGFRFSRTPTSPNWNEPSTRTTDLPSSVEAAIAMLTAIVVRPTPPFGEKIATTWPSRSPPPWPPSASPVGPAAARSHDRRDRAAARLLLLPRVDLADRGGELVAAERLDEELARAREHRPAEVVGLALDGHHDDRGVGDLRAQALRGLDAVHVGHVDVHQDDVRRQLGGELEGLRPGRGRADHFDVALEPEQLRQVIAGLRDVVHDEDTDLVSHWSVSCCPCLTVTVAEPPTGAGPAGPTRPSRRLGAAAMRPLTLVSVSARRPGGWPRRAPVGGRRSPHPRGSSGSRRSCRPGSAAAARRSRRRSPARSGGRARCCPAAGRT